MLKGHVFSKQLFGNPIFALFINTFLNGINGVSNNYKNGMQVTYNGNIVTIQSGAACIQGRFLEEDTSSSISAGTSTAFCKLVIEIDLDKTNTESEFNQGVYKIVKGTSSYPILTQTNIVKNNSGKYQYELARFKTGANGITDFQDMRTFLDFDSIYNSITSEYRSILTQLQKELSEVENGSAYILNEVEEETVSGTEGSLDEGSFSYIATFKKIGKIVNVTVTVTSTMKCGMTIRNIPSFAKPSKIANGDSIASSVLKDSGNTGGEGVAAIYVSEEGNVNIKIYTEQDSVNTKMKFVGNLTYIC